MVACNSATAVALPQLQASFDTPIVGVVMPGARAAVQATRTRRVGLMATEATVRSGSYQRALHVLDAGIEVEAVACPLLAPLIQEGDVFSERVEDAVREYVGPLKKAWGHGDFGLYPLSLSSHPRSPPARPAGSVGELGGRDRIGRWWRSSIANKWAMLGSAKARTRSSPLPIPRSLAKLTTPHS